MSENLSDSESKKRFSSRVAYYVKHRPDYPDAVLDWLREAAGFTSDTVVADVGSGTGLLAELFLKNGCLVYGVEPNADMRAAGEEYLRRYPNFRSIDGAAEETTLAAGSVDLISVGQAFHWFDAEGARSEFARILRPDGWVMLAWNSPRTDATPFMRAYKAMRDHVPVNPAHPRPPDAGTAPKPDRKSVLYGWAGFEKRSFENQQEFDWEGLRGRILSESGAPLPGDPRHPAMMAELEEAFRAHQESGRVIFLYDTELYLGRVARDHFA